MTGRGGRRALRRIILSSANLPAAISFALVLAFGIYADRQSAYVHMQSQRADVQASVGLIRARLEGNINGNIQLVRGLVAVFATEPRMTQERFSTLAGNLVGDHYQIRNIAAAPDFVVRLMHPMQGNERAIGLDYLANERQRAGVLKARDTGQLVLVGPIDLVQGGRGFIGRFPVYLDQSRPRETFWGIVSAVIDVDRLFRDSGLYTAHLGLDIAIADGDGSREGSAFFGKQFIFAEDPVTATVYLPSGSWTIAARPTRGWEAVSPERWLLRGLVLAAAFIIAVPLLLAGRLGAERRENLARLKRREEELKRLSRRLGLALDVSTIGVWEVDLEREEVVWDDRLYEIYGQPRDETRKTLSDWDSMVHPDDLQSARAEYDRAVATGRDYASEFRIVLPDGSIRHMRARATIYTDPEGRRRMIGAEWDVSADVALTRELSNAKAVAERRSEELEAANQRIEFNALHDPLTGLPNRRYLDEVLDAARGSGGEGAALLHIDLDRFKQINDTLGHAAGDAMLVHAAGVLGENAGNGDFVARIGGDEFVVFCTTDIGDDRLALLADRIIRQMRQPVPYQGHECRFGVSVGIALDTAPDLDPKRLMVNADIALYRAKSRGRNRYEFFSGELEAEIVRTKRTADEILNALEREEFVAWYQPQFDANTLEIAGVEALVRWDHPQRGILAPDAFMKTAEELNVVAAIDKLVLEKALERFGAWERSGFNIPRVSVNVSARRLGEDDLLASLRELPISPGALSFELVESIFMDDSDDLIDWNVDRIKELGIEVEIDDFGTGYASIVSLLKLKPRRLKIDRQLVTPILDTPAQRKLVQSIIDIGKSLDIEVVAEGVETMGHATMLRDMGCDMLQGYAFARPMSDSDFDEFVRARRWRKAS